MSCLKCSGLGSVKPKRHHRLCPRRGNRDVLKLDGFHSSKARRFYNRHRKQWNPTEAETAILNAPSSP